MLGALAQKGDVVPLLRRHHLGREAGMQGITVLQRYLRTACVTLHAKRVEGLCAAVDALIRGGRLPVPG